MGSIPDGVIQIILRLNPSGRNCGPGIDSAFNRNEYQESSLGGKGGRCVRLTTLPPSCAVEKFWKLQTPGALWIYFFFFWCLYGGIFSKLVYILKMDLYGPKHVTLIWFSKTASCLTGICNFTQTCSGDKRHFTFEIIA